MKNYGHDARPYADYREMLDKEKSLQAVIVATPDFIHAEQTNACLKAGLHVYCEKVMANSLEAARSMARTARETGKLLQIGYQRRSNPRYRHVVEKLLGEAKLPGRLIHAAGQWNHPVAEDAGWPRKQAIPDDVLRRYGYADMHELRNWRTLRKFGGGPLADFGAHQIDVFNWFLGRTPKSVLAAGGIDFYKTHQWPDNVMAALEYETAEGTGPRAVSGAYHHQRRRQRQFRAPDGRRRLDQNLGKPQVDEGFSRADRGGGLERVGRTRLSIEKRQDRRRLRRPAARSACRRRASWRATISRWCSTSRPTSRTWRISLTPIRGRAKLNCPAEEALRTEAVLWKTYAALDARKMLSFTPEDFVT